MADGLSQKTAAGLVEAVGGPRPAEEPGKQARLVFASFLMLFVELALVRWIMANNVFVTEATNLILLGSFLGIGIGFLNARSGRDYLRWAPVALLVLVAFVLMFRVILHSTGGQTPFLGVGRMPALPRPVSFTAVFVLTVAVIAAVLLATSPGLSGFLPPLGPTTRRLSSIPARITFFLFFFSWH